MAWNRHVGLTSVTLGLLAALPAGSGCSSSDGSLGRLTDEQCAVLGAGSPHPDLLPELIALLRRAGVSLDSLVQEIPPTQVDQALHARRCGQADPVLLPIVRFR